MLIRNRSHRSHLLGGIRPSGRSKYIVRCNACAMDSTNPTLPLRGELLDVCRASGADVS